MEQNKYGLSRHVPEEVKRTIRQAARFGCVCCGNGIGTYEHIDPGFAEAREHNPNRMTYLCGSCHLKVSRGIWSKDRIWDARNNPWCGVHGGPHDAFDVGGSEVAVWLGPNRLSDVPIILRIMGTPLLGIDRPEVAGGPFRISGRFYDPAGSLLFSIDKNEWTGAVDVWDIECVGPRITIRQQHRTIALRLCAVPPHGIIVEQADFCFGGSRVYVDASVLRVTSPTGAIATVSDCFVSGDGTGGAFLSVNEKGQYQLTGPLTIKMGVPVRPPLPPLRVDRVGNCS